MTGWAAMNATLTGNSMNTYSAFQLMDGSVVPMLIGMLLWVAFISSWVLFPKTWRRIVLGFMTTVVLGVVILIAYYLLYPLFEATGNVAMELTWVNYLELLTFGIICYVLGAVVDDRWERWFPNKELPNKLEKEEPDADYAFQNGEAKVDEP